MPTLAEIRDLDEVARELEKTLEDTESDKPDGPDEAA
jgi:hypothetical protein